MNSSLQTIPLLNLALAFIPVAAVIVILYRWSLGYGNAIYSVSRMLAQLLLVGYFLTYIFESDSIRMVLLVLAVMVLASSWEEARENVPTPIVVLTAHGFSREEMRSREAGCEAHLIKPIGKQELLEAIHRYAKV